MRAFILLLLCARVYTETFKVCGAYCGPGGCNNNWIPEAQCDDDFPTLACSDLCCRDHDICCGHASDLTICNSNLVECLSYCQPFATSCKYDGVPVPPIVIADAMKIVINWCCGSPC